MYDINKNIHFCKENSLSHPYKILIFYSINWVEVAEVQFVLDCVSDMYIFKWTLYINLHIHSSIIAFHFE